MENPPQGSPENLAPATGESLPALRKDTAGVSDFAAAAARQSPLPAHLEQLAGSAKGYAAKKDSAATAKAYASDWKFFARFCRRQGFDTETPDPLVVGLYLTAAVDGKNMAKAAVSTLERRLAAISAHYRAVGRKLDRRDRHIADVFAGIKRTHAKPPVQKEALFAEDILAMLAMLPQNLRGFRDRAILLTGFAGGLRRSEITGLDCGPGQSADGTGWIEILPGGVLLSINGKTGWREVEIGRGSSEKTCPVAALELWIKLGRIRHGPIFRRILKENTGVGIDRLGDKHVARLVQKTALAAGVRGDLPEGIRKTAFAGHSLRAGLASSAQVDEAHIQRQLGHASVEMTRRYQRRKERFKVNLTKAAGL